MSDTVIIDTKEVDRIMKVLGVNRDYIVRTMAFDVEAQAKMNAPYETTALRNSIYTETPSTSGFSMSDSNAKSKNPKVTTIQHPVPEEGFANVGPCVNYAAFVELGTSRQAAQPYLVPAMESVANKFNSGERWQGLTK
jgi:HK97 gp10 family phage protein